MSKLIDVETNKNRVINSTTIIIESLGLNQLGEVIPIENTGSLVFGWLDMYCGIDWIMKTKDSQVLGIAARVQLTDPKYYHDPQNTFTIRYQNTSGCKTEFEKRNESIEMGYFYPYYTLQAYVQKDDPTKLLSAALIRTKDLYEFMDKYDFMVTEDRRDNLFKVVRWDYLKKRNYKLLHVGI